VDGPTVRRARPCRRLRRYLWACGQVYGSSAAYRKAGRRMRFGTWANRGGAVRGPPNDGSLPVGRPLSCVRQAGRCGARRMRPSRRTRQCGTKTPDYLRLRQVVVEVLRPHPEIAAKVAAALAAIEPDDATRSYRPRAVKRVAIPKAGGGTRNLGIPSVADRVVQQALVQKMTPIFEPLFADCSFGYRPGRSPHMAMRKVWREINEGNLWILDADLRSYFDKIDQQRLVGLIAEEISDGRVLRLIRSFLEAGVIVDGACHAEGHDDNRTRL
jgi:hypothetical protein